MPPMSYDVIWNGTRARGPYLLTDYTPARPGAAPAPHETCRTARVRDLLAVRPCTMRELRAALDVPIADIGGALQRLRRLGQVTVVDARWNVRRGQAEMVYGLTGRDA